MHKPLSLLLLLLLLTGPAATPAQTVAVVQNNARQTTPAGEDNPRTIPLKELLNRLGQQFGVNILIEASTLPDVRVSANAVNPGQKLDRQLTLLLRTYGLTYRKLKNNSYLIFPEKKVSPAPPGARVRELETPGPALPTASLSPAAPAAFSVSGRVTNPAGEDLPGVSVLLKGTTSGTATGNDGNYTLTLPDAQAGGTLVFSFIGYTTEEIAIGNRNTLNVSLVPDIKSLGEVVVVGYGTQQRKDLIGSVGVANRDDFGDVAVSNPTQLIQGKLAGVQVINYSGLPGAGSAIQVRGVGSFSNTAPLYVIDGIQSDATTFNALSPYDVQDITVLKDASSIAIYGAKAANGVVVVTTRKALTGAPRVTYTAYFGLARRWRKIPLLNAPQYIDLVTDIQATNGNDVPEKLKTDYVRQDRTDWQDAIFRTAKLSEHHLSVSGGTQQVTYSLSGGYTNQQAIEVGYGYERFNLRVNTEEKLGKRIRLGQQINFRYSIEKGTAPVLLSALQMPPYAPIYDPDNLGGFSRVTGVVDLNDASNPLTSVYLSERRQRDLLAYGQFFGEIDLVAGLKFRTQASLKFSNFNGYNYQQANANGEIVRASSIDESYGYGIAPLVENILTYQKTLGVHAWQATVGNTYARGGLSRTLYVGGSDFANDGIRQIGVANSTSVTGADAGKSSQLSYFGRLNYGLLDRYLFTASIRRDGISGVFGPNYRFGTFPAFGVAWKISEEAFMRSNPVISELKVRASWGQTGNSNIDPYQFSTNINKGWSNNIGYALGTDKAYATGSTVANIANPNLRWEKTTQTDVGLDVGLFNDQLTFAVDYFNRVNTDLLVNVPLPPTTGVGSVAVNAANAYNRGVELAGTYQGRIANHFRFSLGANATYLKNRVTSLGTQGAVPITGGEFSTGSLTRTDTMLPIGAYWGFKVDHVAVDQADVDAYNRRAAEQTGNPASLYQDGLKPGDLIFRDLDGDGQVTDKDQAYLGSNLPKWAYGVNLNLAYRHFDLMASVQGIAGVQLANALSYWTEGTTKPFNGSTALLDRWRQEGDVTGIPRAGQNIASNTRVSDRFIESGAYARIRNVTLGFTFPQSLLTKLTRQTVSSFRLYLTAQNLFTFTRYTGLDPEVSSVYYNNSKNFIFSRGVDNGTYPQPRTFLMGLQASF